MTGKKPNPFFIVACCCLLLVPVVLWAPGVAASSENSSKLVITARISMAAFNFTATDSGWNQMTVAWQTNDNTTCTVEFGPTTGYGYSATDGTNGTSHAIVLWGLATGSLYHYRVIATDQYGNQFTSTDLTFTTRGLIPVPFNPGSGGGGGSYSPGGVVVINPTGTSQIPPGPGPDQGSPGPEGTSPATAPGPGGPPSGNATTPATVTTTSTGQIVTGFVGGLLGLLLIWIILVIIITAAVIIYLLWKRRKQPPENSPPAGN